VDKILEEIVDATSVPDFNSLSEEERLELISADYMSKRDALWKESRTDNKWVVDGMIRQGLYHLLVGRPQRGKSLLAEQMSICVASGHPFLGKFRTKQGKVLLIDEDTTTEVLTNRLERFANCIGRDLERLPLEYRSHTGFTIDRSPDLENLLKYVSDKKVDLVILDCLNSITNKPINYAHEAGQVNSVMSKLKTITTPLLIHHTSNKGDNDSELCGSSLDFTSRIMGSTMIVGGCDTVFGMFTPRNDGEFVLRTQPRRVLLDIPNTLGVKILEDKEHSYLWLWFKQQCFVSEIERIILESWRGEMDAGITIHQILEENYEGISDYEARSIVRKLVSDGILKWKKKIGPTGRRPLLYKLTTEGKRLLESLPSQD